MAEKGLYIQMLQHCNKHVHLWRVVACSRWRQQIINYFAWLIDLVTKLDNKLAYEAIGLRY